MSATPRPWKLIRNQRERKTPHRVTASDFATIAQVSGTNRDDDALLVFTAVNSHDALVSALKRSANFAEMELAVLRSCYFPNPEPDEEAHILDAENLIAEIDAALNLTGCAE